MANAEYVAEFEQMHNRAKSYNMVLPDGILAYTSYIPKKNQVSVDDSVSTRMVSGSIYH